MICEFRRHLRTRRGSRENWYPRRGAGTGQLVLRSASPVGAEKTRSTLGTGGTAYRIKLLSKGGAGTDICPEGLGERFDIRRPSLKTMTKTRDQMFGRPLRRAHRRVSKDRVWRINTGAFYLRTWCLGAESSAGGLKALRCRWQC